jgi:hypothetical protein
MKKTQNKRDTKKFRKSLKNKQRSIMNKTIKNGEMVKEVTNSTNEKSISFDELKRISDENFGRFNRSVNYEMIEEKHPNIKDDDFKLTILMEHFHFMGEPTEIHYRCMVQHPQIPITLFQDICLIQWKNIN